MLVNTQLRRKLLFESDLAKHGKSQAELAALGGL